MVDTASILVMVLTGLMVLEEAALLYVIRHQRWLAERGSEAAKAWAILPWYRRFLHFAVIQAGELKLYSDHLILFCSCCLTGA